MNMEYELNTNLCAQRVSITTKHVEPTIQGELERAVYALDTDDSALVDEHSPKILIEEDLFDLFDLMDEKNEEYLASLSEDLDFVGPPYGTKYSVGDQVHCNRFNGPHTDDIHYSKLAHPIKAATNFNGSDCDVSLQQVTFCRNSDKCNLLGPGSRAACSTFTAYTSGRACPKTYHSHTYEFAKFDTNRYFNSPWYGK